MAQSKDRKMAELGALIKLKLAQENYEEAERLSVELLEVAESTGANNQLVESSEPASAVLGALALSAADEQVVRDREHLKLLTWFHYIVGGSTAAISCMFLIHVAMGIAMLVNPTGFFGTASSAPPPMMAYFFVILGSIGVLSGWLFGLLTVYSGRCIKARKRFVFSFIVAALCCLNFPLGTILGVCTILTLNRHSIRDLYNQNAKQIASR